MAISQVGESIAWLWGWDVGLRRGILPQPSQELLSALGEHSRKAGQELGSSLVPPTPPQPLPPVSSKFHVQTITTTSPHTLLYFGDISLISPSFQPISYFFGKQSIFPPSFVNLLLKGRKGNGKKDSSPLQTLTPGWVLRRLCQPWMELCIMNKNCCQHALGSKH